MRWCINGELMVLVAVVPKHAQCPAVLLSELPPKSFHGWTVRTLLHKKATSVPGSQVLLIGSEALIQYQSPSTIQINCVKIRTVTSRFYMDSGGPGWSRRRYLPINYCIATFLYILTIILYLVVYTCSYTESRVESRESSSESILPKLCYTEVGGRGTDLDNSRTSVRYILVLVTPLLPSTILLFVSPILLFSCPLSSLLYCSLGPSTEGPTTLRSARHLLIHTFMSNALTSQYSIGSPENILRKPHAHLVSGTSSPP